MPPVVIPCGTSVATIGRSEQLHRHSDGREYAITFFHLADGRGWIHDFSPAEPGTCGVEPWTARRANEYDVHEDTARAGE